MRHGNRRVRRDCCVIPSVSRRPRRSVCPRPTPEKARPRRTARIGPRSPTTSGGPARTTCDSASFQTKTEYSFRGPFTPKGIVFRGLTDQGFEAWPFGGLTGAPDHQSQGLQGWAIQATLERGVRDILRSVQGQSRVPSRGIPSRESIDPSDPIEWVRAPPSEPSQALYRTCLRTTSRPLSNGARTSA